MTQLRIVIKTELLDYKTKEVTETFFEEYAYCKTSKQLEKLQNLISDFRATIQIEVNKINAIK